MTGRGIRRRGLGHASAAADCLVPHSLAQHSLPRHCPPRSQMPTARPWGGYVRRYVSEATYPSPPGSGGAAAARRRERKGGAAVCSDKREAPTGKPWASSPCQCPRLGPWDYYARRYPRGRPPSSRMPTVCPWDRYARRYVSEAIA